MTAPKRNAHTLLATVGLLLIPLVALWILLSPSRHADRAGSRFFRSDGGRAPAPGDRRGVGGPGGASGGFDPPEPDVPALPPPHVAAGPPVQAEWTLLGVTVVPPNGVPAPPASLAPPVGGQEPTGLARNPFLHAAPGAVGLWIGVRGGVGLKNLTILEDGRRHAYPVGRFSLVVTPAGSGGTISQWERPEGGPAAAPGEPPPYNLSYSPEFPAPGQPHTAKVTLTPAPFSKGFRIVAQPLSAEGRPTGRAVRLLCQPVTVSALFAQMPAGYDAATRQFQFSLSRADGKGGTASWRITNVPLGVGVGAGMPAPDAHVGPFTLHLTAAEAEDASGSDDPANRHSYEATRPYVFNADGHAWTGVPTVHYRLTARAASPPPSDQSWQLQVNRLSPQWIAPPAQPGTLAGGTPGFIPLFPGGYYLPGKEWSVQEGEIGAAYPGQQHRMTLAGEAIRSTERTETVTFHDADVVHDDGFGGDRLVWRHPETQTTASGIAVSVLNGRPGRRDAPSLPPSSQNWWYDRGNAELLVAWRLPPGIKDGWSAAPDAPRVARWPSGFAAPQAGYLPPLHAGPVWAVLDVLRPEPYVRAVMPPGGADAEPLRRAGFSLLRLSVWRPGPLKRTSELPAMGRPGIPFTAAPGKLPPYSWRDGFEVLTVPPLPRHLPTLTLQIMLHEEQERRPFHLVASVRALPSPGAGLTGTPAPGRNPRPPSRTAPPLSPRLLSGARRI